MHGGWLVGLIGIRSLLSADEKISSTRVGLARSFCLLACLVVRALRSFFPSGFPLATFPLFSSFHTLEVLQRVLPFFSLATSSSRSLPMDSSIFGPPFLFCTKYASVCVKMGARIYGPISVVVGNKGFEHLDLCVAIPMSFFSRFSLFLVITKKVAPFLYFEERGGWIQRSNARLLCPVPFAFSFAGKINFEKSF